MEVFAWFWSWIEAFMRELANHDPFGVGADLLSILFAFLLISVVISVFWKGGRG